MESRESITARELHIWAKGCLITLAPYLRPAPGFLPALFWGKKCYDAEGRDWLYSNHELYDDTRVIAGLPDAGP